VFTFADYFYKIMMKLENKIKKMVYTDASMIITEACVKAGSDVFIGYPITPSNRFYQYGTQRFPAFLAGPDEITVMQWMAGFSAAGKFPVTATAFPGLALMAEGLNMAYAMELPMLLILTQRLGPSTGSATTGAQGDLMFLNGLISGKYPIPVFSHSDFEDAWDMTYEAIKTAMKFRTPTVLLTSKELVMTNKSFDLNKLKEIKPVEKFSTEVIEPFEPYKTGDELVPAYIPLGDKKYQVRINASTHNNAGLIKKNDPESMANTRRLKEKFEKRIDEYTFYDYDKEQGAKKLIVTYGISADASRDAVVKLREEGEKVSLLIVKTLLPVPGVILDIINDYENIIFVEENISGIYKEIIFGINENSKVSSVNKIGNLISPSEIIKAVRS